MKSITTFVVWLMFIAMLAAGLGGYVAWTDYVQPQWERFQQIEKRFDDLLKKLPKPFREEGDEEISATHHAAFGADRPAVAGSFFMGPDLRWTSFPHLIRTRISCSDYVEQILLRDWLLHARFKEV